MSWSQWRMRLGAGRIQLLMWALRFFPRGIFRLIPSTSLRFGPPRRWMRWEQYRRTDSHVSWRPAIPAQSCSYGSPTTDAALHQRLWRDGWPELGVAVIPQGRVFSSDGLPIGRKDTLLIDLATGHFQPEYRSYTAVRCRHDRTRPGRALNLVSVFSRENYCHLVLDALPRLELFWRAGFTFDDVDWVLVPAFAGSARDEFLRVLGVPEAKRVLVHPETQYTFETLFQPSFPGRESFVPPWVAEFYRERVLAPSGVRQERKLRLYVARAKRGLANDDEIWPRLERLGFIRVEPKTWEDNVRLFASADVVVGPHGAGLANVIFSPPGATLIEIMSGERYFPYFYSAAAAAGLKYRVILTSPLAPAGTQYRRVLSDAPYSVDGDTLIRCVESVLSARNACEAPQG